MPVRDEILSFLRNPKDFAGTAGDPEIWLSALERYSLPAIVASGGHALRPAQEAAWRGLSDRRAGLILGPPGTGKTYLLSWLIAGYMQARLEAGLPCRVFVTAFTRNAIANVLEAVATRFETHFAAGPRPIFFGTSAPEGLSSAVERNSHDEALAAIGRGDVVLGGTTWSLYRLLVSGKLGGSDSHTAPVFDLVCIDEASQMVLSQGLMALGGLAAGGRVVVAGDDQQLAPIRKNRSTTVAGRELGGSLYAFLKSTEVAEFALDETFRLNAPLTAFPERAFYAGRYRSLSVDRKLALQPAWQDGLLEWQRIALDPAYPIVVFIHDGPSAASSNPFEAKLAADLATALRERVITTDGGLCTPERFWSDVAAIVSPHRAQNLTIRNALPEGNRASCFVETVDRIQGKERDAVLLSYCVSDPEFAVAEGEFIFSSERLNVAITRARSKLVVFVSHRLLDAAPTEQQVMDKVEILREFIFSCEHENDLVLDGPDGSRIRAQVRVRAFEGHAAAKPDPKPSQSAATVVSITPDLENVLKVIRGIAVGDPYGTAKLKDIKSKLARAAEPFDECRELHRLGLISLGQIAGPYSEFWVAKPCAAPRRVFDTEIDTVRQRIEQVVRDARQGMLAPFYSIVRERFLWMAADKSDALMPILRKLHESGFVVLGAATNGSVTVDVPRRRTEPLEDENANPEPALSDNDFRILNQLEDVEAKRINFGVLDGWFSAASLAQGSAFSSIEIAAALGRLQAAGYVLLAEDGRIRSRMAELAREVRHVKQRFKVDDADERPYLVRSLKMELRDRRKPERRIPLAGAFDNAMASAPDHASSIAGVQKALQSLWGEGAKIAGFQQRGFESVLSAWRGEGTAAIVFAADTGSGKTEAAVLPMIAAAAVDRLSGIAGVRAILTYPRVRLVANQAQRLTQYLAELSQVEGMPLLTIGMQVGQVPRSFAQIREWDREAGWEAVGPNALKFPFFGCPQCEATLHLLPSEGANGADALVCSTGDWRFDGWVGSKDGLIRTPPSFFLPTTDSLHQWMHDPQYGVLFGDDTRFAPPRAFLADEIHLYTHIHGAQVGLALRRLIARAEFNDRSGRRMVAVGMSATLGEPAYAWRRLLGDRDVLTVSPEEAEMEPNPRGREYFYFVQPEVESRGKDIAGASTTIQSLMCLAHGMRRRTGNEGGFRSLVFLDSIDKVRRMHSAFVDAEEGRELAALRTCNFPDDSSGTPRTACCKDPVGCDRFSEGECWWFAANDTSQRTATGRMPTGASLKVAPRPIYSGTSGDVEKQIKDSDIVFATSSLEVGYDDPNITLVYQHYAPQNLASFVQRKGRGGRGVNDRPITAVTLSIYSPRDTWWFRRPGEMVSPTGFEIPVNPDNFFVRRGQAICAALDAMARAQARGEVVFGPNGLPTDRMKQEVAEFVEHLFGADVWREFNSTSIEDFWNQATSGAKFTEYSPDIRKSLRWAPALLFDTINLPTVQIQVGGEGQERRAPTTDDISMMLHAVAPGNATRRFDTSGVYWRPPVQGRAPWFDPSDYEPALSEQMFPTVEALRNELPSDAHELLADVEPVICRPTNIRLERLGRVIGAGWTPEWVGDASKNLVQRATSGRDRTGVKHESSASLRGFLLARANASSATLLDHEPISRWVARVETFVGTGTGGTETGLRAARVYWGADAAVQMEDPRSDPILFTQTFTHPTKNRALLHGYQVETEGIRFQLDSKRLDAFQESEMRLLTSDESERRWRAAQFMRYRVESRAQGMGVNAYEARRGAELIVAAAGDPELRKKLLRLVQFWDAQKLTDLLEETRAGLLPEHPLLSARRVAKTAKALGSTKFKALLLATLEEVKQPEAMAAYLRSVVVHGLALRLRQSFIHVGRGDERRVLVHAKLPIQFPGSRDDTIIVCEAGAHGDGTTRAVAAHFDQTHAHWLDGFISGCINAEEDEIVARFWTMSERHAGWRALDPREPNTIREIAAGLAITGTEAPPASVLRILYDTEAVGAQRFDIYDLAQEIGEVRTELEAKLGRSSQDWELASAACAKAKTEPTAGWLAQLLKAYSNLDDAADGDSLSASARLADQVHRIGSRLCADGCRGCVHQSSELMSDSLVEVTVSRQILGRFLCT